jgi:hypothetical protein
MWRHHRNGGPLNYSPPVSRTRRNSCVFLLSSLNDFLRLAGLPSVYAIPMPCHYQESEDKEPAEKDDCAQDH